MYGGGESPKIVVGAVRDTAILRSDSSVKPKREPGNDVGAIRDTAGPKFYFKVESNKKAKPEDAGRAEGDSCHIVSENPLVKICGDKVIFGTSVLTYFKKK